jgi:hypothetical protein
MVVQADPELTILQPQSHEYWDYRFALPCLAQLLLFDSLLCIRAMLGDRDSGGNNTDLVSVLKI